MLEIKPHIIICIMKTGFKFSILIKMDPRDMSPWSFYTHCGPVQWCVIFKNKFQSAFTLKFPRLLAIRKSLTHLRIFFFFLWWDFWYEKCSKYCYKVINSHKIILYVFIWLKVLNHLTSVIFKQYKNSEVWTLLWSHILYFLIVRL